MASQQTSLTGTPRPYFWIRRNRDTFVPLIPLDELPDYIRLSGVSVTKNWDDVRQGEMRFVGDHHDHSGKYFTVDVFNQPHTANCSDKAWEPNSSNVDAPSPDRAESVSQAQQSFDQSTPGKSGIPHGAQSSSQESVPKFAGNAGTLGKKVYCTYWIRTGNCNYMQEGCKFKHEIPPDDDTRLAIGVRTYPTWPREDPVESPRPSKASPSLKSGLQQSWRRHDAGQPASASPPSAKSAQRPEVVTPFHVGHGPSAHGDTFSNQQPITPNPIGQSEHDHHMSQSNPHHTTLNNSQQDPPFGKPQEKSHSNDSNGIVSDNADSNRSTGFSSTSFNDVPQAGPPPPDIQADLKYRGNTPQQWSSGPSASHKPRNHSRARYSRPQATALGSENGDQASNMNFSNLRLNTVGHGFSNGRSASGNAMNYNSVHKPRIQGFPPNSTFAPAINGLPGNAYTHDQRTSPDNNKYKLPFNESGSIHSIATIGVRAGLQSSPNFVDKSHPQSSNGLIIPGRPEFGSKTPRVNLPGSSSINMDRLSQLQYQATSTPSVSSSAPMGTHAQTPASGFSTPTTLQPVSISAGSNDDAATLASYYSPRYQSENPPSPAVSSPVYHRRRFREPGQSEFVANPPLRGHNKRPSSDKGRGRGKGRAAAGGSRGRN